MKKSKTTLLFPAFEVAENEIPLSLSFFASRLRYVRLLLLTSLHSWLKSPVSIIPFP